MNMPIGQDWISLVVAGFNSRHPTELVIEDFASLADGWHRGMGKPIPKAAIDSAIQVHRTLLHSNFLNTKAFPGLSGEIQIVARAGGYRLEFTLEPSGLWDYVLEFSDVVVAEIHELSTKEIQRTINAISEGLWSTLSFSLTSIGTKKKGATPVWRLSHPAPTAESLALNYCALTPERLRPVDISETFTQTLPETRQSIGVFHAPFYQTQLVSLTNRARAETIATEILED